jgi:hypothetical protein
MIGETPEWAFWAILGAACASHAAAVPEALTVWPPRSPGHHHVDLAVPHFEQLSRACQSISVVSAP